MHKSGVSSVVWLGSCVSLVNFPFFCSSSDHFLLMFGGDEVSTAALFAMMKRFVSQTQSAQLLCTIDNSNNDYSLFVGFIWDLFSWFGVFVCWRIVLHRGLIFTREIWLNIWMLHINTFYNRVTFVDVFESFRMLHRVAICYDISVYGIHILEMCSYVIMLD